MKGTLRKLLIAPMALAGTCLSSAAFAGSPPAVITYGPGGSPVPTLGGTALIALALLLAVIAFRVMRSEQYRGVNLVIAATAATAIAAGTGGIKLIADARAIDAGVYMDSETGGEVDLRTGYNMVTNTTGVPLAILDISLREDCKIGSGPNGGGPNGGGPNGGTNGSITRLNGGTNVGECSDSPSTIVPPDGDYCGIDIDCFAEE